MEQKKKKIKIIPTILIAIFAIFWIGLISGNIMWTSNTPPLQVIPDMKDQQLVKAQSQNIFFADRKGMRDPVEGTMPRNGKKYSVTSPEEADIQNVNTMPKTEFVLARGKNRFETFCSPCHGMDASGNGKVVMSPNGFKPAPPDLHRDLSIALSDGRIFHVISFGQNLMPSYADKLPDADRWAVVNYLRVLQGKTPQATISTPNNSNSSTTTPAEAKTKQ